MRELAAKLQATRPEIRVSAAFLSLQVPDLPEAVAAAAASGASEIRILPLFFFSGKHVRQDIPLLVARARTAHPGLPILLLEAAGLHGDFPGFVARAADL